MDDQSDSNVEAESTLDASSSSLEGTKPRARGWKDAFDEPSDDSSVRRPNHKTFHDEKRYASGYKHESDDEKRLRRLEANRKSAAKSRERRNSRIAELQKQATKLSSENIALAKEVELLKAQIEEAKKSSGMKPVPITFAPQAPLPNFPIHPTYTHQFAMQSPVLNPLMLMQALSAQYSSAHMQSIVTPTAVENNAPTQQVSD